MHSLFVDILCLLLYINIGSASTPMPTVTTPMDSTSESDVNTDNIIYLSALLPLPAWIKQILLDFELLLPMLSKQILLHVLHLKSIGVLSDLICAIHLKILKSFAFVKGGGGAL